MKVLVIKDLSIWVAQCGHGREALKISRSASKITFPVLSILRLKTLPNSIFPHYSTGRAKKSRSIKSWQLSRIRWFTAYLVFGRLGFWIEGRLFCSEGLVRLAKSKKRPRKSFLVLVCFGFGLLGFELENVSARKVWSDWRRVRRGRADPLQADGAAQRPQRHDSITYCPPLDICLEKMIPKSRTALLWTFLTVNFPCVFCSFASEEKCLAFNLSVTYCLWWLLYTPRSLRHIIRLFCVFVFFFLRIIRISFLNLMNHDNRRKSLLWCPSLLSNAHPKLTAPAKAAIII